LSRRRNEATDGLLLRVFRPEVWSLLNDVSTLRQQKQAQKTNGYIYSTFISHK